MVALTQQIKREPKQSLRLFLETFDEGFEQENWLEHYLLTMYVKRDLNGEKC